MYVCVYIHVVARTNSCKNVVRGGGRLRGSISYYLASRIFTDECWGGQGRRSKMLAKPCSNVSISGLSHGQHGFSLMPRHGIRHPYKFLSDAPEKIPFHRLAPSKLSDESWLREASSSILCKLFAMKTGDCLHASAWRLTRVVWWRTYRVTR